MKLSLRELKQALYPNSFIFGIYASCTPINALSLSPCPQQHPVVLIPISQSFSISGSKHLSINTHLGRRCDSSSQRNFTFQGRYMAYAHAPEPKLISLHFNRFTPFYVTLSSECVTSPRSISIPITCPLFFHTSSSSTHMSTLSCFLHCVLVCGSQGIV